MVRPAPKGDHNLTELESLLAERCEQRFHTFIVEAFPHLDPVEFVDGRHLHIMAEYLEAFLAGEIPRLLINIPPGHMKSLLVGVLLNAWAWIQPEYVAKRFMSLSYRGDLALRDADKTRKLIRSNWYQERWGNVTGAIRETRLEIRKGQDVKSRFENTAGGYRFSTAVSGIMGEGGDFVQFDDPHNVEVAESDETREEVIWRIKLALPTRVRSIDGGVVCMMQRLHKSDYAGHMIADEADLVHLCLPARYEKKHPHVTVPITLKSGRKLPGDWRKTEGELLWPEMFPEKRLAPLELQLGAYGKSGQLQQRPTVRGGTIYKLAWFGGQFVDPGDVPRRAKRCRGWDLAATKKTPGKTPDYTAGVKLAKAGRSIYIENVVRFRGSPNEVRTTMKTTADQDGKGVLIDFPQDPGQAGVDQAQSIAGLLAGYRVHFSPESGSKETRQDAPAAQVEAGNVYIVRGPWNQAFIDELVALWTGDFDDQADGFARAFTRLIGKVSKGVKSGALKGAS